MRGRTRAHYFTIIKFIFRGRQTNGRTPAGTTRLSTIIAPSTTAGCWFLCNRCVWLGRVGVEKRRLFVSPYLTEEATTLEQNSPFVAALAASVHQTPRTQGSADWMAGQEHDIRLSTPVRTGTNCCFWDNPNFPVKWKDRRW